MAFRKGYRLESDKSFLDELPVEQQNAMYSVDEDFTSKREWLREAKERTEAFNKRFNTTYKYQDFFGEPEDISGWCYCTYCKDFMWDDDTDDHEC